MKNYTTYDMIETDYNSYNDTIDIVMDDGTIFRNCATQIDGVVVADNAVLEDGTKALDINDDEVFQKVIATSDGIELAYWRTCAEEGDYND